MFQLTGYRSSILVYEKPANQTDTSASKSAPLSIPDEELSTQVNKAYTESTTY